MKILFSFLAVTLLLSGCQATGDQYASDVYDANDVNTQQDVKAVKIISVMSAKIKVDNSEGRREAQMAGGLIGAVVGGVIGSNSRSNYYYYGDNRNTAVGAAVGAGAGAIAGSMVDDKVIVKGVTIVYKLNGRVHSSSQIGKKCMFKKGTAILVTTKANETRIQPNAECPVEEAK